MTQTVVRTTVSVCVALVCALIATGFINSAYERERAKLADRHYRSGKALMRTSDLTGAAEEFRKALLFAPDKTEYRLWLATALVNGGKLEEAESHLEQLVQEDPTNGRINLLLAQVAEREHHPREALESYQRAVYEYWPASELSARRAARWQLIGLLKETGQNRDQLVGELLQLYGNLPPHSDQRLRVGSMLLEAGADAEAAHVFHDILSDPSSQSEAGAYGGLARIAYRAGDFLEARHEYQRVLRIAPDDLATADALRLTNEIVDIAPELPNISSAERLRRSQNLFNRVRRDLDQCMLPADNSKDNPKDDPKEKKDRKAASMDDQAAYFQQTAQDLWKNRSTFCAGKSIADPAVEAVLPRLGHES